MVPVSGWVLPRCPVRRDRKPGGRVPVSADSWREWLLDPGRRWRSRPSGQRIRRCPGPSGQAGWRCRSSRTPWEEKLWNAFSTAGAMSGHRPLEPLFSRFSQDSRGTRMRPSSLAGSMSNPPRPSGPTSISPSAAFAGVPVSGTHAPAGHTGPTLRTHQERRRPGPPGRIVSSSRSGANRGYCEPDSENGTSFLMVSANRSLSRAASLGPVTSYFPNPERT